MAENETSGGVGWVAHPDEQEWDDYFRFLDALRESGETNMFGARPYLMDEFGVSEERASDILKRWMKTFGQTSSLLRARMALTP